MTKAERSEVEKELKLIEKEVKRFMKANKMTEIGWDFGRMYANILVTEIGRVIEKHFNSLKKLDKGLTKTNS